MSIGPQRNPYRLAADGDVDVQMKRGVELAAVCLALSYSAIPQGARGGGHPTCCPFPVIPWASQLPLARAKAAWHFALLLHLPSPLAESRPRGSGQPQALGNTQWKFQCDRSSAAMAGSIPPHNRYATQALFSRSWQAFKASSCLGMVHY